MGLKELDERLRKYELAEEVAKKQITEYAHTKFKETKARMRNEYGAYVEQKIKDLFKKAMSEFYDAYTPHLYDRTDGLFDLLDIETNSDGMPEYSSVYDLVDPVLHGREGVNIFDTVFKEGYHGGATGNPNDPGGHYYREPEPYYTNWGREAVKTESPEKLFFDKLLNAENNEMSAKLAEIKEEGYGRFTAQVGEQYHIFYRDALAGGV